jgi:hypothetical protein
MSATEDWIGGSAAIEDWRFKARADFPSLPKRRSRARRAGKFFVKLVKLFVKFFQIFLWRFCAVSIAYGTEMCFLTRFAFCQVF